MVNGLWSWGRIMRKDTALIDVYILEILEKYAAKEKPMYRAALREKLKEYPYEITVSDNTISRHLAWLREEGRIKGQRGVYKPGRFDDHELRLLIDGVLYGKHVPEQDAKVLIDKLKSMSELGLSKRVRNVHYLSSVPRTENKKLYDMIDKIDEAIIHSRKIKVKRCRYNTNKELVPIEGDYILDPYYLVADKSRYYLICRKEKNGIYDEDLVDLRVDRFWKVEILHTKPAADITEISKYRNGFYLDEYLRQHLYMVSGETVRVTMRLLKDSIGDFIDWYGKDFSIIKDEGKNIVISFLVTDNALVYWALQYGKKATILSPESVRERMKEEVKQLGERYSAGK